MMRYKKYIAGALLSSLLMNGYTQDKAPLSLQECIDAAIANNATVKQNEFTTASNEVYWQSARANLLPGISASVSHGINQGRSIDPFTNAYSNQQTRVANYGLDASLTLFSGFRLMNLIRQNSLAYEAGKMTWQQSKDRVALDVMLAYLQILNNTEQLAQVHSQLEVTQKQVERLNLLNQEGATSPGMLYDMKGQLANDQLSIISTRNALNAARLSLSQLMNKPYDPEMTVEPLSAENFMMQYNGTPDSIYQVALEALSLVKAARLNEESAVKGVKAAKGIYFPTLRLNGSLGTNYSSAARNTTFLGTQEVASDSYVDVSGNKYPVMVLQDNYASQKIPYYDQISNNYGSYVGVSLSIPILNGLQAHQQVKLAKINQEQASYTYKTTLIQLKQNIEQDYFNMAAALERYKTLSEQVDAFTESFRIAEVQFNNGVITSVDYLVAQNNLNQAKTNLITARYDFLLRTKILDYYMGKSRW